MLKQLFLVWIVITNLVVYNTLQYGTKKEAYIIIVIGITSKLTLNNTRQHYFNHSVYQHLDTAIITLLFFILSLLFISGVWTVQNALKKEKLLEQNKVFTFI